MVEITVPLLLDIIRTVGILVGIVYYITIMRNQQKNQELARSAQEQALGTRQAQLMYQIWNDYERFRESGLFWRDLEYEDFDDFWRRYSADENPDFWRRDVAIMGWYERIGVLVKTGLLDVHLMALSFGGPTRMLWENLEPILEPLREKFQYPRLWSETEYLCKEVIKYMEEHPELKT
jgi:hypothetical protein